MSRRVTSDAQTPPPRLADGDQPSELDLALGAIAAGSWEWCEATRELTCAGALATLRGVIPSSLPQLLAQVHRDDRVALQAAIAGCDEQPTRLDYRLVAADGTLRWVRGGVRRRDGPSGQRVLGVEVDIDAHKREVAEQRAQLDMASRAQHDKERFVYICSHDLREPLRMVTGFLTLLERRLIGLDLRQAEFMRLALEGARRLDGMLEDLLRWSRCGRTRRPGDVASAEALAEAWRAAQGLAPVGTVSVGELPMVWADRAQLISLFQELLTNAAKFRGPRHAEIRVSAQRGDAEWIFTVADAGIGIPPEERGRVFEVFQRLHLRDAYAGNGMGLAMCARIIEQHRGRIWIEQPADEAPGTVVRFALPDHDVTPACGNAIIAG
jgi:signal transduction histidine kinase